MYDVPSLFIGGAAVSPAGTPIIAVRNPANEELLGEVPSAGADSVAAALAAAEKGHVAWGRTSPWGRSEILRRTATLMAERRTAIATVVTLETGKPLAESLAEVQNATDHFDWCADEARRVYGRTFEGRAPTSRFDVQHQPVGVVVALTPWNFPVSLPARKLASGLAAGCALILRPASETPGSAAAIIACCRDAGVPDGAVNLLFGEPDAVIEPLLASSIVRKVSFTGSIRVGQILIRQCAETLKRVTMELGGHAPYLVLEDADLDLAARTAVASKFRNSGQVCTAPSRFYVHASLAGEFTERFAAATARLNLGNGLEPGVDMGPLTTLRQRDRAERLVADAIDKGARVVAGGSRTTRFNKGYFYDPTILADVPADALVLQEEPFTPLAPIVAVASTEEAVSRANALEYGLAAYVFTRSAERLHRVTGALEAGLIGANTAIVSTAEAPFGGMKASGFGREGGEEGIRDYLTTKFIHAHLA